MVKLDKSRPYGQVHGLPGVCYEQDSRQFNGLGEEVPARPTLAQLSAEARAMRMPQETLVDASHDTVHVPIKRGRGRPPKVRTV